MKNIITRISLVLMIVTLTSCFKPSVEVTPESMKGNGLLVGHVSASGNGGSSFFSGGDVYIGEERHRGAYKDSFITVPLAPGKYSMNKLLWSFGNGGYKSLPIKAEFTIKAGEVTNLGEIFLLFPKKDSRYNMLFIDNNDDMHAFLRSKYSKVYGGLKKKINKANVKYIGKQYVDNVRRVAVGQIWKSRYNKYLAIGPLGSIGIYKKDKKGKIKSIKWVKTDTYMSLESCVVGVKKTVCIVPHMTKGDRLFFANGSRYKLYKKPSYLKKGRFQYVKDGSILWLSNDLSVYRSRDGAKTWKLNYKADKSLNSSVQDLQVTAGKHGIYVYTKVEGSTILYSKYKTNKFVSVEAPAGLSRLRGLVETSKGLYTGLEWTLISDGSVFYKSHKANSWIKRKIPETECGSIKLRNYKKDEMHIMCAGKNNMLSSEEGLTMKKIGRVEN